MIDPVILRRPVGDKSPTASLYYGTDCREALRRMPSESVHCVVTSPPYWGLREYNVPEVVWGDGWKGHLGLEPTPNAYVEHLVEIFHEVWRVLRDDGTLWVNLGDTYSRGRVNRDDERRLAGDPEHWKRTPTGSSRDRSKVPGFKEKDLVGIPWLVAFALKSQGWFLRNDIVWSKINCLPESVEDRCTRAHEYVFHLTKSKTYYYDIDAIREPHTMRPQRRPDGHKRRRPGPLLPEHTWSGTARKEPDIDGDPRGRNKRTVWPITTIPYPEAHFATFPPELPRTCVLAGTSDKGCCPTCGAPWTRIVETSGGRDWRNDTMVSKGIPGEISGNGSYKRGQSSSPLNDTRTRTTVGWEPSCRCAEHEPVPCTVLDPFSGSGTTGMVSLALGRNFLGIDLSESYVGMAARRIETEWEDPVPEHDDLSGGILDLLMAEDP
jgi:DNA modification methylase